MAAGVSGEHVNKPLCLTATDSGSCEISSIASRLSTTVLSTSDCDSTPMQPALGSVTNTRRTRDDSSGSACTHKRRRDNSPTPKHTNG